jgi:ABC-type glycerol-3-phosphate transport system permease component
MADVVAVGTSSSSAYRPRVTARVHRRLGRLGVYAFLTAGALVFLLPYLWMVSASLKPEAEVFEAGLNLVPREVRWQNYADAWRQYPLGRWLLNTFLVASVETVSTVVTSVLAGFAFARLRFWGRDQLFYLYLGAMMVPIQVTLIPSFIIVRQLGLLNTYEGIAIIHLVQFFGVFLMRQFLLNIPSELEDAARIDGCSWFRVLWQIVLPISMPAVAALSILAFTAGWNDFLWPLVVINKPDIMTIIVGLASLRGEATPWGLLMAATTISALPLTLVYVLLQRWFTEGITMSGIKG